MKKFVATLVAITIVGLASTSLQAAQVRNTISGSLGIAENACVLPISLFVGLNCEFSGGPAVSTEIGIPAIGPLNSGGFYASAAAAPGFTLSTQTGSEFDHLNRPLTSFLVGLPASVGDGKVNIPIDGVLTIDDGGDGFGDTTDTVAGTIVIGPGARLVSAGSNNAGSKTIIESWTSVTHTLLATAVSSAAANGGGGFDYVIGSRGFPTNIFTAIDSFASEMGSDSGEPAANSPWIVANGGSGFNYDTMTGGVDIVSFGTKGMPANIGAETTALIAGLNCSDVGTDPTEADTMGNPVIDTITDCQDSSVAWGVTDPTGTDAGKLNAGFDNLVLQFSTNALGEITAANAYYTMEYPIILTNDNSWVGGTLSFTGVIAPPCVAGPDVFRVIDDITAQTLDVLANDSCDDPPLTIVDNAVDDFMPDKGGAASTDGAIVTYTPAGGGAANDPETFTYTVEDTLASQGQGTVTITLFDDVIPVANNIATTTELDTPVSVDVSSGGDDPTNNLGNTETAVTNLPGTGSIVTETAPPPMLGIVSIVGANVTYTPNAGERGDDTFGYTLSDSNGDSANAEISVRINAMPVAPDFTVANKIGIGGSEPIDVAADIPGADLGNPVATIITTAAANGTTAVAGSVITYTHSGGACGDDGFDYTITDDDLEADTGAISLTVNCVPLANDADGPDINTAGVSPDSQTSAIDAVAIAGNDLGDEPTALTAGDGANGTTAVAGNTVTYTPNADFYAGVDTFDYTLTDDDGDTATGMITVTLPDVIPTAGDLAAETDEGVAVDIDVIGSITPGNGSPAQHAFSVSSNPGSGAAQFNGTVVTYSPDPGSSGTDSFEYTVTDGDGSSASATITVTVAAKQVEIPVQDKLPGGSNALGSELALLLILLPWLRRRRIR
jgi:hypothetical protein